MPRDQQNQPPPEWSDLTLANLLGGQVEERFQEALQRVAENVDDPNTKEKQAREVVVRLKMTPLNPNRRECTVEVDVTAKLAAPVGVTSPAIVRKVGGRYRITTHDLRQQELEYVDVTGTGGRKGAEKEN